MTPADLRRGFFSENIMEIKIKLQNGEIAEKACAFARNMNGVGNAEYDGEEIAITLSPNGSENVVKSAVEGYIEAMGGRNGEAKPKNVHSRLKSVLRIAVTVLFAAAGAITAHFGAETASLFLYIAAYIIISWDVFLSIGEKIKEKHRPQTVETLTGIITLAMFVIGWYLPAVAAMMIYQCVSLILKRTDNGAE